MGHLISIVNYIVKLSQETQLGDKLKELKPDTFADLEEFKAAQLAEVMEKQEKLLVREADSFNGLNCSNRLISGRFASERYNGGQRRFR